MGANDSAEMLEVAKAECLRLEQENAQIKRGLGSMVVELEKLRDTRASIVHQVNTAPFWRQQGEVSMLDHALTVLRGDEPTVKRIHQLMYDEWTTSGVCACGHFTAQGIQTEILAAYATHTAADAELPADPFPVGKFPDA